MHGWKNIETGMVRMGTLILFKEVLWMDIEYMLGKEAFWRAIDDLCVLMNWYIEIRWVNTCSVNILKFGAKIFVLLTYLR